MEGVPRYVRLFDLVSRLNPSWPGLCRTNPDPIRWLGTCQERIWARPVRRHRWFPGGWGIFETRVSGQNLPCLSKHVPMKHVNPMANPVHLPWQTYSEWMVHTWEPNADWEGYQQTIWNCRQFRRGVRWKVLAFVLVGLTVFLAGHRQCHQYPERWLSENMRQIPKMEQTAEWKKVDPVATGWGGCRCRCRSKRKTDLETGDLDVPCVFAHWNISCQQLPFWMFGAAKGARMGLSVLHAWDVGQRPKCQRYPNIIRKDTERY